MTSNIIAIKGNFIDKANEIFSAFRYIDTKQDEQVEDWQEFNNYLCENYFEFTQEETAIRGLWSNNNWTYICDPEMVDSLEVEALIHLSKKYNTDVATFTIQTNSNTFGFSLYNSSLQREFLVIDGEIINNQFTPIKEEAGLNLSENTFSHDILELARRLKIDLTGEVKTVYTIKKLTYSDEMKKELEVFRLQQKKNVSQEKPWWKFW